MTIATYPSNLSITPRLHDTRGRPRYYREYALGSQRFSVSGLALNLPMLAGLWLLDRVAGPYPETEDDRIRAQRKERLRRAFPKIDVDGTGPRSG